MSFPPSPNPGAARGSRLAPPFQKGNPGGPGNPFAGRVAKFRSALWAASSPERQAELAELLWQLGLGLYEQPVTDAAGQAVIDEKTGRPMVMRLPPQKWAISELLNRLLGRVEPPHEDPLDTNPDADMHLREAVMLLMQTGLASRVPRALQSLSSAAIIDQPSPPASVHAAPTTKPIPSTAKPAGSSASKAGARTGGRRKR